MWQTYIQIVQNSVQTLIRICDYTLLLYQDKVATDIIFNLYDQINVSPSTLVHQNRVYLFLVCVHLS